MKITKSAFGAKQCVCVCVCVCVCMCVCVGEGGRETLGRQANFLVGGGEITAAPQSPLLGELRF